MASRDIKDLCPELRVLAKEFLTRCAAAGLHAILIQTWRSAAEQDADYARGRTLPGNKITNARAGESPHNCVDAQGRPAAKAFDFALYAPGSHSLDWDADDAQWHTAICILKDLGLVSGSTFHGVTDSDHAELSGWRTRDAIA